MKTKLNNKFPPRMITALGIAAMLLRAALFLVGEDAKGLLIPGHPLDLLVWTVTAAAAVVTVLSIWELDGSPKYADNFSPSTSAAIGAFALAGGIAVSVISGWYTFLRLEMIRNVCGLLAVPALIWAGLCRREGKQPFFLSHALVCLYLTLFTVSHYQVWSSRPQLQDYFFTMSGSILLALFAYYQTAFDVGMGKRRMQLGTGLLAAFFCIAALAGGEDMPLYLGGTIWTLTNLCSLFPVPRRRKNPLTPDEKDDSHEAA